MPLRRCRQKKELFKPVRQDILVANKIEEVQAEDGETLDSVFNQALEYQLSSRELANKTLCVMAWSKKFLGRNQYLREVNVRLAIFEDTAPRFHTPHDWIEAQAVQQQLESCTDDTAGQSTLCANYHPLNVNYSGRSPAGVYSAAACDKGYDKRYVIPLFSDGGEWVSRFLTVHQHILGYLVPYNDVEDTVKKIRYNQGYLAMIKYE